MRFMPTLYDGFLDYTAAGALIIAGPWLGFAHSGPRGWMPVLVGIILFVVGSVTDYDLGRWPLIPMRVHLAIDGALGAALALSPWIFGFAEVVWAPPLVVGLLLVAAALVTCTIPGRRGRPHLAGTPAPAS